MNAEILARLEQSFAPDPSALLATALQPVGSMSDADRARVGQLLIDLGAILAKSKTPKQG